MPHTLIWGFYPVLLFVCVLPVAHCFLYSLGFAGSLYGGWKASLSSSSWISSAPHHLSFAVSRRDFIARSNGRSAALRRSGLRSLTGEAPQLKDVVLPPCKRLCPGCEPWICPLAPKATQVIELSESSIRLEELRKEKELEAERARMEAVAAGVQSVHSLEELHRLTADAEGLTTLIFWGGAWCRKCTALKPKFVSLSQILAEEYSNSALQFVYADAKAVGSSRPDLPPSLALKEIASIQSVPTFQCWRGGRVLRTYTAELEVKKVMPSVVRMVDECLTLTDTELLSEEAEADAETAEGGGVGNLKMLSKWENFDEGKPDDK